MAKIQCKLNNKNCYLWRLAKEHIFQQINQRSLRVMVNTCTMIHNVIKFRYNL